MVGCRLLVVGYRVRKDGRPKTEDGEQKTDSISFSYNRQPSIYPSLAPRLAARIDLAVDARQPTVYTRGGTWKTGSYDGKGTSYADYADRGTGSPGCGRNVYSRGMQLDSREPRPGYQARKGR